MRLHALLFLLPLSCVSFADIERGAPLPRKGFLGVQTAPDSKGVKVARVVPGGSAEKIGLKEGDVILKFNKEAVADPAKLVALARATSAGADLSVHYLRDGKESDASGKMAERPKVTEADMDVVYDQVMSLGKRIRIIITKPKGSGKFPVVFMIGGIGSYSMDAPFSASPYGNILSQIAKAGFVTVRVDKPGMGDSEGPSQYKDLTFSVEEDAYVQALRLTKTLDFVDPARIAVFGHSMGGCFGPLVAAKEPVKALIVSGTLMKSFNEYMLENTRRQSELSGGAEEALDQEQKLLATTMHYLFDENMTPAQISEKHPELAEFVKATFPDGETYSGVGIPFFRELSQSNLAQGWKDSKCSVLSLYAENDFLSGRDDHERIATFVNKLRPGTAEFKLLPESDHGFTKTSSMRDSMQRWGQGGEFNPLVVTTLLDYLKKAV